MKNKKLNLFIALGIGITTAYGQQSANASGGNATGSGGSVAYSVGQVVYTTNSGANGSVAQGVQQPYEISTITGIEASTGININATAFPNPSVDYITLKISDYDISNLQYSIYDATGKVIETKKITTAETKLSVVNLPVATYFIKISNSEKEIKSFKLIKN